jgi:hypothetical protein
MDLQQEAELHMQKKDAAFMQALLDCVAPVEEFLFSTLHNTVEREKALEALIEASLWARRCSEVHGVK